jgi:flagellar biosynthesis/type III secretory pathway M-ring protein FliF/YscJ
MSAAHYNTFALLETVWNYILYPVGLLVLILGVFILVRESREAGEEDDSEFQGPERKDSEDSQVRTTFAAILCTQKK